MNKYTEMKQRHQEEFNKFPMKFAFSNEQLAQAMKELGLKPNEFDKVYSYSGGGIYLRSDSQKLRDMFKRWDEEQTEAMKDEEFVYQMFLYELANHEYIVTYELEDTLNACGLTYDEVQANPMWAKQLEQATDDYLGVRQDKEVEDNEV